MIRRRGFNNACTEPPASGASFKQAWQYIRYGLLAGVNVRTELWLLQNLSVHSYFIPDTNVKCAHAVEFASDDHQPTLNGIIPHHRFPHLFITSLTH